MTRNDAVDLANAAREQLLAEMMATLTSIIDESLAALRQRVGDRHVRSVDVPLEFVSDVASAADEILERLPDVMVAALPEQIDDGDIVELRASIRDSARRAANQAIANLRRTLSTDLRPN